MRASTVLNTQIEQMRSIETLISNKRLWAGRIISGLPTLFLLVDGGMKLYKPQVVVEATVQMGYPESAIVGIGIALLLSTLLYLLPRTSILGAILLTGYLGGAVASQVRVSAASFNIIFPALIGALLWSGLLLRDRRLQALIPLRAQ